MNPTTAKKTATTTSNLIPINSTQIEREIILDKTVPNGPFKVYCVLAMLAGVNEGYASIPIDNAIIEDASLSEGAFRLYCILAIFVKSHEASPIFVDTTQLANLMGRSKSTAQRYINELVKQGIVERVRCATPDGLHGTGFVIHDSIRDSLEAE